MPDNNKVVKEDWFKGRLDNSIEYKTLGTDGNAEFKSREDYWEDDSVKEMFSKTADTEEACGPLRES